MTSQSYPSPEGNESLRFDIYTLQSTKIRKNHLLCLRNVFSGTPYAFPCFLSKTKKFVNSHVNFSRCLILINNCSKPLVKQICQNSSKSVEIKITMFASARSSCFGVTVSNLMIWAKKPPPVGYRVNTGV